MYEFVKKLFINKIYTWYHSKNKYTIYDSILKSEVYK